MARNEVFYNATRVSLPVGAGVVSGDPVRVGSFNGVAQTDAAADNAAGNAVSVNSMTSSNEPPYASVALTGAWRLTVAITGTGAIGDPVYATTPGGNKKATLTNVAAGAKLFGVLLEATSTAGSQSLAVVLAGASV